jgi:hypothetical protein
MEGKTEILRNESSCLISGYPIFILGRCDVGQDGERPYLMAQATSEKNKTQTIIDN